MKKYLLLLCSFCTFSFTGNLSASDIVDNATGITFPSQISFEEGGENFTLEATGVTTRKKIFAKVYSIAHYMQNPVAGSANALVTEALNNDSIAKQLTMQWVRRVNSKKISDAYASALEDTMTPSEHQAMQKEIDRFIGFFGNEAQVGDIYIFRWLPRGKLIIEINGKQTGEINNPAFAKSVWEIWLGSDRVVKRAKLVSLYTQ